MNKKKIAIVIFLTLALMTVEVYANASIKQMFTTQYDNQGTELDECATCMRSTSPPASWNPYGTALKDDADFDRNNIAQALENIEELDSDGDGFNNIDEIRNSTYPGDPDDFPEVVEVTQTQTQTQTPTPTSMETAEPTEAVASAIPDTEDSNGTLNSMFNALFTFAAIVLMSIIVRKKNI
ncbi:MAG: hypothetical protein C5S45_06915 [Candidatus Methanocomedens sp.]|nr:MAG: hypothetical protein C5S45_06915 [ANME-2 cluster archaeon]